MLTHMTPRERNILTNTCFGHFMSHFNMLAFPAVVLPLAGKLDMGVGDVLGLSFWMYLLFGIMALPWGILADRIGPKYIFMIFYFGAGICGLASAASLHSPARLTLTLAGIGFFSAIYHPVGLGMIAKEIKKISLGMGFNGMFGNLGLAMAPFLVGVCNWLWGPKSAYLMLGSLNLLGALIMFFLPLSLSRHVYQKREGDDGHLKGFLILLAAMTLGGIVYRGASVILPAYFEIKNQVLLNWLSQIAGNNLSANLVATASASLIYLVGMAGQYIGGHIAHKVDIRKSYLFFHAMTVPLAVIAAFVTDIPLIFVTMGYFFFLLGMQPSENTLVSRFTPKHLQHSAYGFKFILTFGVGAFSVHMVGSIQSGLGLAYVFPSLGAVSVLLVGTILLLISRTKPVKG